MTQYGFYVDLNACIGCKACQMACKDRAQNEVGANWRRVIDYAGGEWRKQGEAWVPDLFSYSVPTACHHCSNPPCLPVCPTAAIDKDENGIVTINVDECIGCHLCEWACPWGAPIFYEALAVVAKCDYCKDIVDAGGSQACWQREGLIDHPGKTISRIPSSACCPGISFTYRVSFPGNSDMNPVSYFGEVTAYVSPITSAREL